MGRSGQVRPLLQDCSGWKERHPVGQGGCGSPSEGGCWSSWCWYEQGRWCVHWERTSGKQQWTWREEGEEAARALLLLQQTERGVCLRAPMQVCLHLLILWRRAPSHSVRQPCIGQGPERGSRFPNREGSVVVWDPCEGSKGSTSWAETCMYY